MNRSKVFVIDSMMGNGKTSWAIQHIVEDHLMNGVRAKKFLYVTPYLDEVDRVMTACKNSMMKVYTPKTICGKSKSSHLKDMLMDGKNIITTHALFDKLDETCLDVIKSHGYTLYMDEVHEVVKRFEMSDSDLSMLTNSKYIKIKEDGLVEWIAEDYEGRFEEFRNLCNLGSVYKYINKVYIWCFPVSIFKAMDSVYILTYFFRGQIQCAYYQLHGVECVYKDIVKAGDINYYTLIDWDGKKEKRDMLKILPLINVCLDEKINYDQPRGGITLSSSWFTEKSDAKTLKVVKDNLGNYFKNKVKGSSDDNMWTTLKDFKLKLKGKGYTKGFVELNARATNKYKHKKNLAYVYNRYLNPVEKNFFKAKGCDVDEDLYALSELLQWVFRSRIREGKSINLYLPSRRMRELFGKWILDAMQQD